MSPSPIERVVGGTPTLPNWALFLRAKRQFFFRLFALRWMVQRGFRRWNFIAQPDERGTQQPALKRESRHGGVGNDRIRGRFHFAVHDLLPGGVKRFARRGRKRREANAARRVAAGVLELRDLLREFRLAGAGRGGVQRENVVEDAHERLQPLGFAAMQLFDFQPERGLLAVVHFLHELGKLLDFFGHFDGDFVRAVGNLFGLRLDVQPFTRGGTDLRGELFQVLDFFGNGAERAGINDSDNRAVIEDERQRAEHRAERDAGGGGDDFPSANRMWRPLDEKIRRREQQRVAEQKRPLGNRPMFRVVHAASLGKKWRRRKKSR